MATNPGEIFRKKLIPVLQKYGTPVNRHRESYTDSSGTLHKEEILQVKVLDTDDLSKRFVDIAQYFDVGSNNQNNPGMLDLIYAADSGTANPEAKYKKAPIDEGDELHFNGWSYTVTRQKPLPIAGVNCFRHLECKRERPL